MRIYPFCDKKTLNEVMPVLEREGEKGKQKRKVVNTSNQMQKKEEFPLPFNLAIYEIRLEQHYLDL